MPFFNHALQTMREAGILEQLNHKWQKASKGQEISEGNTMVFYPQLTKFWIILIFESSEDLALIR